MLVFTRVNSNGKRVAFDPVDIGAVLEWEEGVVGIRVHHPDPIKVVGDFLTIKTKVENAKAQARTKQMRNPITGGM